MNIKPLSDPYHTPEIQIDPFSRLFPSAAFYARILSIVCEAAWRTRGGGYSMEKWAADSLTVMRRAEAVGIRFHIENVSAVTSLPGPCVVVANHMSTLETFCMPGILATHRPIAFVIKRSLTTYPIFQRIVNAVEPIAVDRVNARDDFTTVMEQGQERLARGISVIVFPQTTRTLNLDRQAFNSIGIKLAKKAGVPVVPLALKTDAWGLGKLSKDYGCIRPEIPARFCFGDPMMIRGAGKNEHEEIMEFIHWKLTAWSAT
jgi:1-acyl-sn-glycerol-3-phosphate acyltransferase